MCSLRLPLAGEHQRFGSCEACSESRVYARWLMTGPISRHFASLPGSVQILSEFTQPIWRETGKS
jgi:hypothetical protein